jgi:hypothetical protein
MLNFMLILLFTHDLMSEKVVIGNNAETGQINPLANLCYTVLLTIFTEQFYTFEPVKHVNIG